MRKLDGKVALITGAAQGIGASAARLFVEQGARVLLADIQEGPLHDLAAALSPNAIAQVVDITSEQQIKGMVELALSQFGRLDIAILNAGISGPPEPLVDYPTSGFDQVMAINVRGTWLGLKYAMKAMANSGGSIVVTASTSSVRATPNRVAYVASKHAVLGLMRAAAIEGAAQKIRVNCVNPATIDTPMVRAMEASRGDVANKLANKTSLIPMGRQGTAEEVAAMMLFLASDEASFCTGGVYMVDGGVTAGRAA